MKTIQAMKKMQNILNFWFLVLMMISVLVLSCTRSQFSSTSRKVVNGKTTYVNHYHRERLRFADARPSPGKAYHTNDEATGLIMERLVPVGLPGSDDPARVATGDTLADTIRSLAPVNGKVPDLSKCHRIKLKDGPELDINVVHQDSNRFYYRTAADPGTPVFVRHDKVEWAIVPLTMKQDQKVDSARRSKLKDPEKEPGFYEKTRKFAGKSLTFSLIGVIPIVGIPFSILGIIYGAISLRRMYFQEKPVKGKGKAIAGLVIGVLGLAAGIIWIIMLIGGSKLSINLMH